MKWPPVLEYRLNEPSPPSPTVKAFGATVPGTKLRLLASGRRGAAGEERGEAGGRADGVVHRRVARQGLGAARDGDAAEGELAGQIEGLPGGERRRRDGRRRLAGAGVEQADGGAQRVEEEAAGAGRGVVAGDVDDEVAAGVGEQVEGAVRPRATVKALGRTVPGTKLRLLASGRAAPEG